MIDISTIDYSEFDRREILMFLFHPRPEGHFPSFDKLSELLIPVASEVNIGAHFYHSGNNSATILFFHGNGEIAADYVDLAPRYIQMNINFLPVDYRGYGRSNGTPTITGMMRDCHIIFHYVKNWLSEHSYTGPLFVMGRSLGSASALELAFYYKELMDGLIIESGFALAVPLLRLLGINTDTLGIKEESGFRNIDKIKNFDKPVLIIHAEHDHIIPHADGEALFNACPSEEKRMITIPRANHNTIFMYGMNEYMQAIKELVDTVKKSKS